MSDMSLFRPKYFSEFFLKTKAFFLYNHSTMTKLRTFTLTKFYGLIFKSCSAFTSSSKKVLYSPTKPLDHIVQAAVNFFDLLQPEAVLQCFVTLMSWSRSGQLFCGTSLSLSLMCPHD